MLKTNKMALLMAALGVAVGGSQVQAQTKMTYLFPAPPFLPAFSPFQIAKHKGIYKAAGLDVAFQVAKGGADVAKQVGVGNAELGGGIGDTAIIVRANGVNVRGVALLGGRSLTQIVVRKDANINSFADLKGKNIGVLSFQDTTYYNLLGVLKSAKLNKSDASIQAVGPAGVVKLMIAGNLQAISGTPDWAHNIQSAGVGIKILPIENAFPAMAQAIVASDKIIKDNPDLIRKFVGATLQALRQVIADPKQAAKDFVAAVPRHKGKEKAMEEIFTSYGELVYKTDNPSKLGAFDEKRLAAVQKFYVDNKIVRNAVPIKDTYTNKFVGN